MLKLALLPEEYMTIDGRIVVQVTRVAGGRAYLAVEAAKEVPIVRGTVWEREGGERPACIGGRRRRGGRRYRRDRYYIWNDDRERAVRRMEYELERLEGMGIGEVAQEIRKQLERLIPAYWEGEVEAGAKGARSGFTRQEQLVEIEGRASEGD